MFYTQKIHKAIEFATQVHQIDQNQTRNDKITPYIVHVLSVALILSRASEDEDTIVAGILHDTIEDCTESHKITKEVITQEFGNKVAELVDDVTDKHYELPKMERKKLAIAHIANMRHESLLLKTADQLHNLSSIVSDIKRKGVDLAFSTHHSTLDQTIFLYQERVQALEKAWSANPLLPELNELLKEFFRIVR